MRAPQQPATVPRFIADVHLGRLARLLRMLGFDTGYEKDASRPQLLKTAVTENRVLLTRAASLAQNPFVHTCVLASEDADAQLAQVVEQFGLSQCLQPFSRCLVCNQLVLPVSKTAIAHLLEPRTAENFTEFWQCSHCQRIYWKGSHFERMLQKIKSLGPA